MLHTSTGNISGTPIPSGITRNVAATVIEYCGEHVRAMQPVSVFGLRSWLLEQLPEATTSNVASLVDYFLAEGRRQLAFDTYEVTEYDGTKYEVVDFYENCR